MTWDVIISGAGIIGVSLALELRQRGARILVLDRGQPGKEASSAAAGMLSAADPETPKELQPLALASAAMYPAFVANLEAASGIKTDFRHGTIELLRAAMSLPGYEPVSPAQIRQLDAAVDVRGHHAYLVAGENSVDPDRLMQAVLGTAQAAGVEIRGHIEVRQMSSAGKSVEVVVDGEHFVAQSAVNCQGAWAGAPVRPRKGQLIYLQPKNPALLKHVLRTPEIYLVPRSSGKILVGSTVEDVGFDKEVVPETVQQLHRAASRFVSELAEAPVIASWAGLRPGTPDDLPILGKTEPGIFIASGHFRNGILLAPITARIMADLITGKAPALDISAFSPSRFMEVAEVH